MPANSIRNENHWISSALPILGLSLAISLGALPASARQNQPGEVQASPAQQNAQDQAAPNPPTPNLPAPGDPSQNQPMRNDAPPPQAPPSQAAPPSSLTLPAGTVIRVRVDEWLSSDRNAPGDIFSAILEQPIVVDGWVVARRGQAETGTVGVAKKAGHAGGSSQLGVELSELTLVDGQQLTLQTQMQQTTAGTSHGQDAAIVGTTTGVGAAIGAVAEGGTGAAVGAGVGALAGLIGVISTRGKPTVIPPETVLSFRLQAPVTISTERSQFAFEPVTQRDYDGRSSRGAAPHMAGPGEPGYPPPPYYGYPYPYYPYAWGIYPAPLGFGFYGGYGYGPRYGGYWRGFRR